MTIPFVIWSGPDSSRKGTSGARVELRFRPPGNEAATWMAEAGRLSGSFSMQRSMARSTSGSMSLISVEGLVGVLSLFRNCNSCTNVGASKAFLPVNTLRHSVPSSQTKPPLQTSILFPFEREFSKTLYRKHS